MNKKIENLYKIIFNAYEEIEKIRKKCQHSQYYVSLFTWKTDRVDPQRVCVECEAVIDGITKEEIEMAFQEHNISILNFHIEDDRPDKKKDKDKNGQGGKIQ